MEMKVDIDRVRQLRRERAMSQEELAGATGLSLRTIQRIETDGVTSLESKKALACVFQVELETLDDTREERARFLRGLNGGTTLGMAGALIGGASAYWAIYSSFAAGEMAAADAGVAAGIVGVGVGLSCALIGAVHQKLRTRTT
ncbi:MAG TPA: helix-turn-helix transcriptional regulator [Gammaproteobacteria bacterium]|jgi:transcriptional regulator with XRE-family HTH domain